MNCLEHLKRGSGFILLFIMILNAEVFAQAGTDASKLQIGDKAPELRYGKWIKGIPSKLDEPDRLYVVEFWATWCGPCIAMMPRLSELAKKREKEMTVIGANIWEGKAGDSVKSYDSFLPKVEKFIKGMGDKMAYNVIMDDNEQFMGNNWMKAAGQEGIPTSFIIKNGIIQWIGHPINLDSIVTVVNDPKYDVASARKAAMDRENKRASGENETENAMKSYQEAVKQKDFAKALKITDEEIGKGLMNASAFSFFKFQTLLENVGEDTAMAFLKKWQSEYGGFGFTNSVGVMICRQPGLKKDSYLYGIAMLKREAEGPRAIPAMWYHHIAAGYANMGDYKTASETQQKAIDLARQALKDGKFTGFILEDTVTEYEKALDDYKKKMK